MELLLIIGFLYIVYAIAGSGSGYDSPDDSGLSDWEKDYTIWRMTKNNRERRHNRKK